MSSRSERIEAAYAAHARGEFAPLLEALDPDVVWVELAERGEHGEAPCCENRGDVVARLARLYERGRRFRVVEREEGEEAVVLGLELRDPAWPLRVVVWKLVRFDPESGRVIRIEDCAGRGEALAAL